MTAGEVWKRFDALLNEIEAYERCLGKVQFDMECYAPPESMEQTGADLATVAKQVHKLRHGKRYRALLERLHADPEGLTDLQKHAVEKLYGDYAKTKNVSPALAYRMSLHRSKAYSDWLQAKKAGDFSLFRDSFAQLIADTRQAVGLREERKATVYDTLLDDYEPGGSVAQLDAFFGAVKGRALPLIRRIREEGKPIRDDFMSRPVPRSKQEPAARFLLKTEGLRESALVLATTEHPFTDHYGPRDVRVTTHYYENRFVSNLYTILHEGGHALFMQNEPEEFYREHTADRMTAAMHECISRFYENRVGRSEEWIAFLTPYLRKWTGRTFADVSPREWYEAVNIASPGLIRMEADELTYCLHIAVRYELEKAFVNGEITVDQIPALWNAKYKEYLGLDVPDDGVGCLQDMHWTGMYGYFPSYALGNAYGAQIYRTMEKDFDVSAAVRKGDLKPIGDWLKERVFSIASLNDPDAWIKAITGESLNVEYYLDYLEKKFTALYQLK